LYEQGLGKRHPCWECHPFVVNVVGLTLRGAERQFWTVLSLMPVLSKSASHSGISPHFWAIIDRTVQNWQKRHLSGHLWDTFRDTFLTVLTTAVRIVALLLCVLRNQELSEP